ncbi:MarR family winged helix-turn-helix transcriptional regulator [Streptococcus hongkongensis]|nr:MarR family transcriptional regulator [Streptococcus uberis]
MKDEHIGVLIKMASLEFDRQANHLLLKENITPSQFKILKYLTLRPQATVRQIDLESFFGMTNPTVTGIIQNLEKKGLITRQDHPLDKRSKVLLLTESALAMHDKIIGISNRIEANFTKNLQEEDTKLLKPLLIKLLNTANNKSNKGGLNASQQISD